MSFASFLCSDKNHEQKVFVSQLQLLTTTLFWNIILLDSKGSVSQWWITFRRDFPFCEAFPVFRKSSLFLKSRFKFIWSDLVCGTTSIFLWDGFRVFAVLLQRIRTQPWRSERGSLDSDGRRISLYRDTKEASVIFRAKIIFRNISLKKRKKSIHEVWVWKITLCSV